MFHWEGPIHVEAYMYMFQGTCTMYQVIVLGTIGERLNNPDHIKTKTPAINEQ